MKAIGINRSCCSKCVFNQKQGFIFKNKEECKTYSCSCLENESLLLCEKCQKNCHKHTDGHQTTEVSKLFLSEFICACNSNSEKLVLKKSSKGIECLISKIFKDQKSFFYNDPYLTDLYFCKWCVESCEKKNKYVYNLVKISTQTTFKCSCKKEHSNHIVSNFEKINDIIKNVDTIDQNGKRINLMRMMHLLMEQDEFKLNFRVFEEITQKFYEELKFENYKQEEVTIICKNVANFIKKFYKNVINDVKYENDYVNEIIKFSTIKKMISKIDSTIDIKISCLKIFKCMIFSQPKSSNFIKIEKEKNITPLHRLICSLTVSEFFQAINIITKNEYFELMEIIIDTLKTVNNNLSGDNYLSLFIQYLDLFKFLCHCKDLERTFILKANEDIKIVIDYISK